MLRIKIINELEIPHKQQIDEKIMEIEKLQEQVYELTREVGKKTGEVEAIKNENEKNIKMIKDRTKVTYFINYILLINLISFIILLNIFSWRLMN